MTGLITDDAPSSPTRTDPAGDHDPRRIGETTMLLSRMAETIYWTGRYLERAETTARVIKAHTELYLDLPRSAGLGWEPLLAITGNAEAFDDYYTDPTEEHVVSFLAADARNAGSILASLASARENMRTCRAIFPREAWEAVNEAWLTARETCEDAVLRRERVAWLTAVIGDVQRVTGMLAGTMTHDESYSFLRMGRQIERADMTSRVLDVRVTSLVQSGSDRLMPYADVQWMSMLKSLTAHQMYRRAMQTRVNGPDALRFLLQDPRFPRSVEHCLDQVAQALSQVPRHHEPLAACEHAQALIDETKVRTLAWEGLGPFVDELQIRLADLDATLAAVYFNGRAAPSAAMLETA